MLQTRKQINQSLDYRKILPPTVPHYPFSTALGYRIRLIYPIRHWAPNYASPKPRNTLDMTRILISAKFIEYFYKPSKLKAKRRVIVG